MTIIISRISLVDVASWAYRGMLVACVALCAWILWRNTRLNDASIFLMVACVVLSVALARALRAARQRFIQSSDIPQFLKRKLRQTYPHLSGKDADLVEQGLRDFFLACSQGKRSFTAMPSQAVDVMWHEFILHTQAYQAWCKRALGYFLHHTPAEVLGKSAKRNDGLRRAWYWACKNENIDPSAPASLPLLFALDTRLAIPDGFRYEPDCRTKRSSDDGSAVIVSSSLALCGTSFSDGSYSGSSADFGGAQSADGDASGDGSGDGGGCGGGGD